MTLPERKLARQKLPRSRETVFRVTRGAFDMPNGLPCPPRQPLPVAASLPSPGAAVDVRAGRAALSPLRTTGTFGDGWHHAAVSEGVWRGMTVVHLERPSTEVYNLRRNWGKFG